MGSEIDNVRRACELAWTALDRLKEAGELMDVGEGLAPPPFSNVFRFCEWCDYSLGRMEKEAERKWKRSTVAT